MHRSRAASAPIIHYPGTKLELVERNGDRVRVRYEGADYDIEISATDLK